MSRGANENAKPGEDDGEVGYGKPPKQHRFKKGQSGNPKGRPKKKAKVVDHCSEFGAQPARDMLRQEAYRLVSVREGDRIVEMPTIQAVFRAISVSALKGNRFAQQLLAELVRDVEEQDKKQKNDLFAAALDFKIDAENAIKLARDHGMPEPDILPHPDDMIVDIEQGVVHIRGPQTKEEKVEWDRIIARRDASQEEVSYFARKCRTARSSKKKGFWLDQWHFEQKMFDMVNDRLPPRYQVKLEDRSYEEGASSAGDFAFDDAGRDAAMRTAFGLK